MTNLRPAKKPTRVLVIEDDQAVKRMLRISLRNAGFETMEATTGSEALQLLEDEPPDMVILDLGLPDHGAGPVLEWLRLREQGKDSGIAWLVVSAMDQQEVFEQYGPLGNRFISKPFDPWHLVRTLEESHAKTGRPEP